MFYTIDIFTRPSNTVPFFSHTALGRNLKSALATPAPTSLLDNKLSVSNGKLKSSTILIRKWIDQASYDAYMTANAAAVAAFKVERDLYNSQNGIMITTTGFTSEDLLF